MLLNGMPSNLQKEQDVGNKKRLQAAAGQGMLEWADKLINEPLLIPTRVLAERQLTSSGPLKPFYWRRQAPTRCAVRLCGVEEQSLILAGWICRAYLKLCFGLACRLCKQS